MRLVDQTANTSKSNQIEEGPPQTTLNELVAALNKEVQLEEDWIATDAARDLLESGRAKFMSLN